MERYHVIIVGGGPSGLSCAIWLTKLGVNSLLLEASGILGGLQTRSPYENLWIPGVQGKTGQEVAASIAGHAVDVGAELRVGRPVLAVTRDGDGFRVTTSEGDVHGRFVVIATGSTPRTGGFTPSETVAIGPGEPMEALDVEGRAVAILGGGDNAFDQARFVRDRGGRVTVFSRGVPRAQKLLQDLVPGIPVNVGAYDARQSDMTVNGRHFHCFGIQYGFEAVVPAGLDLKRRDGYVEVDRFGETNVANVFACGEVTDFWHPCVTTSAAHGVQVAKQIAKRL